jgi:hypothetical protein
VNIPKIHLGIPLCILGMPKYPLGFAVVVVARRRRIEEEE